MKRDPKEGRTSSGRTNPAEGRAPAVQSNDGYAADSPAAGAGRSVRAPRSAEVSGPSQAAMTERKAAPVSGTRRRPRSRRKENYRTSKRIINLVALAVFAGLILFADVMLILHHDKAFSDTENRMLQQFPALTSSEFVSGKFMSRFEDFTEDQIFGRNSWIGYKLAVDKTIGKRDSNGVFLGKQGYLLEAPKTPIRKNFDRNLDAINRFALAHDENIVMTVIPNAAYTCPQLLPNGAPVLDQGRIIDQIRDAVGPVLDFVDVRETLKAHNTEPLYYKSDHHWTSLGARYAFEAVAPHIGIESPANDYQIMTVTDSFTGTMSSSSGEFDVSDTIEICVPASNPEYVVEYVGEGRDRTASVYDLAALDTNNQYEVFLGGNFPLISINTTAKTGRRLLLIKDSYANAFVQFLLPYYDMIQIVDPRYYSDDLENLISMNDISDILLLYNLNTYVEDNYLSIVLDG